MSFEKIKGNFGFGCMRLKMNEDKVAKVVTEHIVNNKPVQEFTIGAYEK